MVETILLAQISQQGKISQFRTIFKGLKLSTTRFNLELMCFAVISDEYVRWLMVETILLMVETILLAQISQQGEISQFRTIFKGFETFHHKI